MRHFLSLLIFVCITWCFSQDLTLEKSRVVVIPASTQDANIPVAQIVDVVIEEMSKLGRFEVLDRSTMEASMQERLHLQLEM